MDEIETVAEKLGITTFPFIIKDDNGNEIYIEQSNGLSIRKFFDDIGNLTYYIKELNGWKSTHIV